MSQAGQGYLRSPGIHRDTVIFVSEDDLWTVPATGGQAARLTAGVSEAASPALSPDGRQVAFVAADDGPAEPYLMPLAGGVPRRLAFQAASRCVVLGWHPRTQEIIYSSTAAQPAGFEHRLFAVPAVGGRPRLLIDGAASTISFAPESGVVVGRSLADPARRKRYRGGTAGELWVAPAPTGPFHRILPRLEGNLASPCWVGERIYFISDHEGVGNVYSCRPDGSGIRRHTAHRDFYARALASDGRRLVYQCGAALYLLEPGADGSVPIQVHTASSRTQQRRHFEPVAGHLEEARLSPDGAAVAVLSRGQVMSLPLWSGPVRRHGPARGVRHRLPVWRADGRLVAVAAGDGPAEQLSLLDPGGTGKDLLDADLGVITELVAAPVGGHVAFATNRQQVWTLDTAAALPRARLLDSAAFERIEDLAWSPDARWLAYTHPSSPHTSRITVARVEDGTTFPVTTPVLRDFRPVFDPGGRYLYFLGQRDLTPELDQVEAGVGFPFGSRPYLVTLRAGDPAPFGGSHRPAPAPGPDVGIDPAGIDLRVVPFPVPEGRYAQIVALTDKVLLLSVPVAAPDPTLNTRLPEGEVVSVALEAMPEAEDHLQIVDGIQASADGSALLVRVNDRLRVLEAGAGAEAAMEHQALTQPPGRSTGWLDLDRVRVAVDPAAQWQQMFREAWRLQRESFWNAGLPGLDWDEVYRRYRPLAGLVATRSELSDLIWELQGELGTSHAYEHGGEYRRPTEQPQGFLGLDWEPAEAADSDRWRVRAVLRGDPWDESATSPCNRPGTDVRAGDLLLAVNAHPVGTAGPGPLLVGQAGREVELTIGREGEPTRTVLVKAAAGEERARYRDWAEQERERVHDLSDGRVGYLHVPDMFATGYRDFVRGFLTELDREGLLVDVRHNGGGQVSPLLLDRLSRRRAGWEHARWSGVVPYPADAPSGVMALLIDENTGSDAEIFAHRFRAQGLGRLIGRRTWGGVVATWPRHELADGTVTTQPEFCYVLQGVGDSLENRGVEPDLEVEMPPGTDPEEDPQLVAGVADLLARLDAGPGPAQPTRTLLPTPPGVAR